MGLFDDLNKFLEARLEEFLQKNPHLELQAIEEQLKKQEQDTQRLIANLQLEEKSLQQQILSLAKDIQTWHGRIDKAKVAKRMDLAHAAQEREAALLRQGNQLWGQMEGAKKRIVQSQELLLQIQKKIQEVKAKAVEVKATKVNYKNNSQWDTAGWNQGANYSNYNKSVDPLETQFQRLEMDEEIDRMKRNL